MRVLLTEGSDKEDWTPRLSTHKGQPYAILSHRWADDPNHEVLFADIEEVDQVQYGQTPDENSRIIKNIQYIGSHPGYKPGYPKIQGAARRALEDGHAFVWIDTCCIDKSSSAELSEAINSMWMWYKLSSVCYVYLADVVNNTDEEFRKSTWWTRGWTLQELLAPRGLIFFTTRWSVLGCKRDMDLIISEITQIDANVVNGTIDLHSVSIAQRMCWASNRRTTRVEDMAYCLLGIFEVNMSLIYGEGANAFLRLQQEIIRGSDDETIFAWRDYTMHPYTLHGMLADSPRAFAGSSKVTHYRDTDSRSPYTMTNKGLSLMTSVSGEDDRKFAISLHCPNPETLDSNIHISLAKISTTTEQYARVRCSEWAAVPSIASKTRRSTIYVKQHYDASLYDYHYDHWGTIDLLRVLQTEDAGSPKLDKLAGRAESSRYSVISYQSHEAKEEPLKTIFSNKRHHVSRSVWLYLELMKRSCEAKLLWIDSICDRHLGLHGPKTPLVLQRRIWASAQECVIWLGTLFHIERSSSRTNKLASPDSLRAMRQTQRDVMKRNQFENTHATLLAIGRHSYWRQARIIPEIFFAKSIILAFDIHRTPTNEKVKVSYITFDAFLDLHASALEDAKHLHKSTLGHVLDYGLPSTDTTAMDQLLEIAATSPFRRAEGGWSSIQDRVSIRPGLDFEDVLTRFQYSEAADPRDRIYSLLAITEFEQWTELADQKLDSLYLLDMLSLFTCIAPAMGKKLTLTVLPKLATAMELSDLPTDTQASDVILPGNLRFNVSHQMYSLDVKDINDDGHRRDVPRIDRSLKAPYSYCTLEPKSDVRGGLVFAKKLSSSSMREDAKLYVPYCLFIRQGPIKCSLLPMPKRYKEALAGTTALLEDKDDDPPHFMVSTDGLGLFALAFCMQQTTGALPKVCERYESHR